MEKMGGAGLQECHRRSPFLMQNESPNSSPFDDQSLLIKDHFINHGNRNFV